VFLAIGNNDQVRQLAQRDQQAVLIDPQQLNSYGYARDNPVTLSDPNGRILPIILGALAVYGVSMISIDTYDVYQTDFKYADVFSPQEKSATNFKLGYDSALSLTGEAAALPSIGLKGYGIALDALTATQDALDTYFSKQIYKTYNDERGADRKKISTTGANVSVPSISTVPSSVWYSGGNGSSYGTPSFSRSSSAQGSGASQSAGGPSSYSQLVSSLSRLVSALSAYVSSLSGSKSK
jgi:hypothetical protein